MTIRNSTASIKINDDILMIAQCPFEQEFRFGETLIESTCIGDVKKIRKLKHQKQQVILLVRDLMIGDCQQFKG